MVSATAKHFICGCLKLYMLITVMRNNSPANPKTPNITWRIHLLSVPVVNVWPVMLVSFSTVLPLLSVITKTKIANRRNIYKLSFSNKVDKSRRPYQTTNRSNSTSTSINSDFK